MPSPSDPNPLDSQIGPDDLAWQGAARAAADVVDATERFRRDEIPAAIFAAVCAEAARSTRWWGRHGSIEAGRRRAQKATES